MNEHAFNQKLSAAQRIYFKRFQGAYTLKAYAKRRNFVQKKRMELAPIEYTKRGEGVGGGERGIWSGKRANKSDIVAIIVKR